MEATVCRERVLTNAELMSPQIFLARHEHSFGHFTPGFRQSSIAKAPWTDCTMSRRRMLSGLQARRNPPAAPRTDWRMPFSRKGITIRERNFSEMFCASAISAPRLNAPAVRPSKAFSEPPLRHQERCGGHSAPSPKSSSPFPCKKHFSYGNYITSVFGLDERPVSSTATANILVI